MPHRIEIILLISFVIQYFKLKYIVYLSNQINDINFYIKTFCESFFDVNNVHTSLIKLRIYMDHNKVGDQYSNHIAEFFEIIKQPSSNHKQSDSNFSKKSSFNNNMWIDNISTSSQSS
ncbi:hypothetical protein PPERSA_11715 [Pseudocohnilembus persalinus]|uniref:Uncharacterized protein n=1 Tax=Pseudocohnilembus persalinus TaxID=266149 RepID=A0A0V0QGF2_PSEPJ|nr:hypothetical protein PPERSA_11715 [Pseudocohnilembus persalinus]|eukprot:KRX01268.1 hypothetical protein PPERSA_11715 [Pseudocohnilembus persalinus]